jgi:hypothetical protein
MGEEKLGRNRGGRRKLIALDLDVDILNLEDTRLLMGRAASEDDSDGGAQSVFTEGNFCEARVFHARQSALLASCGSRTRRRVSAWIWASWKVLVVYEGSIIRTQYQFVKAGMEVKLTGDPIARAGLHIVMRLDGDDVREQISALK